MDYILDVMDEETRAWLDAGGAEIIFDAVRRQGWTVEVVTEDWEFLPEIVSTVDLKGQKVWIDGTKSPYDQVCAVLAAFDKVPVYGWPMYRIGDDTRMFKPTFWDINQFCITARCASEATIARLKKEATV